MDSFTIWTIDDGRRGNQAQVEAMSGAISNAFTAQCLEGTTANIQPICATANPITAPYKARNLLKKHNLKPDMIIGCGRKTASLVAALGNNGANSKPLSVQLMRSNVACERFDYVVVPSHDELLGDNVLSMIGAPTSITPKLLTTHMLAQTNFAFQQYPKPYIGVLIGGKNRHFNITGQWLFDLIEALLRTAKNLQATLLITASPRTDPRWLEMIKQQCADHFLWWEGKDNPYLDILAHCDQLVITGDSVNMISECCASGKPVWIAIPPLKKAHSKLQKFHHHLINEHIAYAFNDEIDIAKKPKTILNETAHIADIILQRYLRLDHSTQSKNY